MKRRTALIGGAVLASGALGTYYFGQRVLEWTRRAVWPGSSGGLDKINNIVVLMLENSSFDNLLGKLYPKSSSFDGLSGQESNPDLEGHPVPVKNIPARASSASRTPGRTQASFGSTSTSKSSARRRRRQDKPRS